MRQDVCKADFVSYLRAEFEPLEIQVAAYADFDKVVKAFEHHRLFRIAIDVEFHASSADEVRTEVLLALRRPFDVQRDSNRNTEHIDFVFLVTALIPHLMTGFGLIGDGSLRETQRRTETQVEMPRHAQVGHKADSKSRHQSADTCVIDFVLTGRNAV